MKAVTITDSFHTYKYFIGLLLNHCQWLSFLRGPFFIFVPETKIPMSDKNSTHSIVIGDKIYKLHALDTSEDTQFLLWDSDDFLCTISYNNGKWQADKPFDEKDLSQIVKWIEELFM